MPEWGFYGRRDELEKLRAILARGRWFFVKITGRRRIGKTTLIQQALQEVGERPVFYVQIPDSGEAGVISAVNDALDTFGMPPDRYPRPRNLAELAKLLEALAEDGYVVVLDEFQYFNRKGFAEFCSLLQAAADRLAARPARVKGGWVVLGSIHTEMAALLEDRSAPLYNRVTHTFELGHLDIASVLTILREHADTTPERLLFLWTLFEGVPKFYRDCYEQGVLWADRPTLLRKMFFESSSPLRTEADNWFLRELRGRYDTVLKFVARHPGMMHNELIHAIRETSGEETTNIGGYLQTLTERYRLIERKLPVFAPPKARQGRYYVTDNFLSAWLAALAGPVSARTFRPLDQLIAEADRRLADVEGGGLEKLVGQLYEERSRRGIGDFPLTERIQGYWDRKDTEIDLVAVNDDAERIRFGSCKRSPGKLLSDITNFKSHADRFLNERRTYQKWSIDHVGVSVRLNRGERQVLTRNDILPQPLDELTAGLI
ncbi:MAG: AAA family ATPase [Zavarzinella sp.]|nr:AAA family ATPase [Zavarzinella sp.]